MDGRMGIVDIDLVNGEDKGDKKMEIKNFFKGKVEIWN